MLDQAGYLAALRAKLVEEAEEAQAAPDGQLRSELADVLEVLQALAAAHGMSWEDVVAGSGPQADGARGLRPADLSRIRRSGRLNTARR